MSASGVNQCRDDIKPPNYERVISGNCRHIC